jgi:hypothetical protein
MIENNRQDWQPLNIGGMIMNGGKTTVPYFYHDIL